MTTEELEVSVNELNNKVTEMFKDLKLEHLEIRDMLADSNIDVIEGTLRSELETYKLSLNESVNNRLSSYVTEENVLDTCYTKTEVDDKISNFITLTDVSNLLNDNNVIVEDNLKSYVNKTDLLNILDSTLTDYSTTKELNDTFVTKSELSNITDNGDIDLSSYVTKNDLTKYYTKSEVDKLIPSTTGFIKRIDLDKYISDYDYATQTWVTNNFVQKGEISLASYVTRDELNDSTKNYVNTSKITEIENRLKSFATTGWVDDVVSKACSSINSGFIPLKLSEFKSEYDGEIKTYVNDTFATKNDLRKLFGDMTTSTEMNLEGFVSKSELSKYALESKLDEYVKTSDYVTYTLNTNDKISNLSNSLKKYVTLAQLGQYLKIDDIDNFIKEDKDVVTKTYLEKELSKLSTSNNTSVDDSNILTKKDYTEIVNYVEDRLSKYAVRGDIYTATYINTNYLNKNNLSEQYYSKELSDARFVVKNEMSSYMTYTQAMSDFLLKEDYRGIKDAMILNDFYNNTPDTFNKLQEHGKLLDGFYIVDGHVNVVKNNMIYTTPLEESDNYSKSEIDENFMTKTDFEVNYNNMQWHIDEGGKY